MASLRRKRRRSCSSKKAYADETAAAAAAKNLGSGWYHCDFGNHWHVGRTSRKVLRAAGRKKRAKQEEA